jgi:hypothetical protein
MTDAAPLYWAYLSRELTMDALPMGDAYLQEKYISIARELNIPKYRHREIYCAKFKEEGMCKGIIDSDFVTSQLQILRKRNRAFEHRNTDTPLEIRNMERAVERIDHFCDYYPSKNNYKCNPNLEKETLLFLLESSEPHRNYEVVSVLWGLFTGEPLNYVQAAQKFGVSSSRVKQIEYHVFRAISKYADLLLVKKE